MTKKTYLAVPEWWNKVGTLWSRSSAEHRTSTGPNTSTQRSQDCQKDLLSPTGPSLLQRLFPLPLTNSKGSPSLDREWLPWCWCCLLTVGGEIFQKLWIQKLKASRQRGWGCVFEYDTSRCEVKTDFTNDPDCLHTAQSCIEEVGWSVLLSVNMINAGYWSQWLNGEYDLYPNC